MFDRNFEENFDRMLDRIAHDLFNDLIPRNSKVAMSVYSIDENGRLKRWDGKETKKPSTRTVQDDPQYKLRHAEMLTAAKEGNYEKAADLKKMLADMEAEFKVQYSAIEELDNLKAQLKELESEQRYEECATLAGQIKELAEKLK